MGTGPSSQCFMDVTYKFQIIVLQHAGSGIPTVTGVLRLSPDFGGRSILLAPDLALPAFEQTTSHQDHLPEPRVGR